MVKLDYVIEPYARRSLGQCLYIVTDLNQADELIEESLARAALVEHATDGLLNGQISVADFLDYIEIAIPDMDVYIDEVTENFELLAEGKL